MYYVDVTYARIYDVDAWYSKILKFFTKSSCNVTSYSEDNLISKIVKHLKYEAIYDSLQAKYRIWFIFNFLFNAILKEWCEISLHKHFNSNWKTKITSKRRTTVYSVFYTKMSSLWMDLLEIIALTNIREFRFDFHLVPLPLRDHY